jgi:hypothetical protein
MDLAARDQVAQARVDLDTEEASVPAAAAVMVAADLRVQAVAAEQVLKYGMAQ